MCHMSPSGLVAADPPTHAALPAHEHRQRLSVAGRPGSHLKLLNVILCDALEDGVKVGLELVKAAARKVVAGDAGLIVYLAPAAPAHKRQGNTLAHEKSGRRRICTHWAGEVD